MPFFIIAQKTFEQFLFIEFSQELSQIAQSGHTDGPASKTLGHNNERV